MENQVVIFFDGHFSKINAELLLEDEFDVDFNGQILVRFLNTNGTVTAINGVDGGGRNIATDVAFKDAEIYYKQ